MRQPLLHQPAVLVVEEAEDNPADCRNDQNDNKYEAQKLPEKPMALRSEFDFDGHKRQ